VYKRWVYPVPGFIWQGIGPLKTGFQMANAWSISLGSLFKVLFLVRGIGYKTGSIKIELIDTGNTSTNRFFLDIR
jgi:hypothetical protein